MTHSPDAVNPDAPSSATPAPKSEKLFTFASGGWVLLLAGFFTLVAAGLVLWPSLVNGFHPPVGDGKNIDTYGFDLSNLIIPRDQLVASGNPKDQIDAIPPRLVEMISPREVDLMRQNERIRFLVAGDRVIGLSMNGETRAYPVRVLSLHELVNDTIGGVPVAVSWSPLCDSAVVFDRRIDGEQMPPVEFGISGLLVDSNPVFYDRRADDKQESLWPQLALRAVSGPAAGKPMKLIPYELVTWQQWTAAHPDTQALLGLRRRKKEYGREQYNVYLQHDDVKFPVDPLWNDPQVRRKTPLVVTSHDEGKTWIAQRSTTADPGDATNPFRLHTFLFAWYAQHRESTDFSRIK